jgi:hypothetical protein
MARHTLEYGRKHYEDNKEYYLQRNRRATKKRKNWFRGIKEQLSCPCGESHIAVLDFHHKDPSIKDAGLHKAIQNGWSQKRILAEIEKCDILCSNCHRKLHYNEREVK